MLRLVVSGYWFQFTCDKLFHAYLLPPLVVILALPDEIMAMKIKCKTRNQIIYVRKILCSLSITDYILITYF